MLPLIINTTNLTLQDHGIVLHGNLSDGTADTNESTWSFIPGMAVVMLIGGFVTNGIMLIVLLKQQHLRTPFNVYLINLTFVNFVYQFSEAPLDVLNSIYSRWWLGDRLCTYYMYATYAVQGGHSCSHALITMNRIWAAALPMSYRNHHSRKVAIGVCCGMWAFVNIFVLVGLIPDTLFYRLPVDVNGCTINYGAQPAWSIAVQYGMFNVTELIVLLGYPYICYKWLKRRRKVRLMKILPAHSGTQVVTGRTIETNDEDPEEAPNNKVKQSDQRSFAFLMLTLLTASVAVTWTPSHVYYSIESFTELDMPMLRQIVAVINSFEAFLDPLYFVIAVKPQNGRQFWRTGCSGCA